MPILLTKQEHGLSFVRLFPHEIDSDNMKKILLWLLPALVWVSCKSAEKTTYTPEQIVPTEKALLWKISGNGLKKPSYLFGTIHMIPKSDYQMTETMRIALDHIKQVAFEIDMKDMTNFKTQLGLMTKSFMAGGKTLKDLLPAEDYTFVKQKMSEKGLPSGMFERMKPMFLSMMFSSEEDGGQTSASGDMTSVEMELYGSAKNRGLETAGLETAGYQMSIFDSIPYEAQAKMLVESLRGVDKGADGENELDKMLEMYRAQDITAMQAMISEEPSGMGNYGDILLNNRNRNWIPVMGRYMHAKPTLFAVGAGHLGGPQGVITLLRKEGYKVEVAQ